METMRAGKIYAANPAGLTTRRKTENQGCVRDTELSLCVDQNPVFHEMECSDRGPEGPGMECTACCDRGREGHGTEHSDRGREGHGTECSDRGPEGPGMECTACSDRGPEGHGMEHSDRGPEGHGTERSDQGPEGHGMEHSDRGREGHGTERSDRGPEPGGRGVEDVAKQGMVAEGQWWHVNRGGFPIPEETWEKMWQHVTDTHPSGAAVEESICDKPCRRVPFPPVPSVSVPSGQHSVQESLMAVQTYLQQLQYNHTGTQFFEVRKNRPLSRLMETAKEIIHDSLPIKCLEAVVVALYLTVPLTNVQRFPLGFKSKCGDMYYRHVVLGVHHGGSYGALGLSRRKDLMYKPLVHKSLMALIQDFIDSYKNYQHRVVKVKLSPPIVHDLHSCEQIQWKFLCLPLGQLQAEEVKKVVEKFSRTMRTIQP